MARSVPRQIAPRLRNCFANFRPDAQRPYTSVEIFTGRCVRATPTAGIQLANRLPAEWNFNDPWAWIFEQAAACVSYLHPEKALRCFFHILFRPINSVSRIIEKSLAKNIQLFFSPGWVGNSARRITDFFLFFSSFATISDLLDLEKRREPRRETLFFLAGCFRICRIKFYHLRFLRVNETIVLFEILVFFF